MPKKNILITGSTGFVGVNLVPYLKDKKYKIIEVARKQAATNVISYKNLNQNIWNSSFAMLHLAGKAHDLKKTSADQDYYEVNRDLTCKLFDDFLKSDCKIFVYVSSVKAVKDSLDEALSEGRTPTPVTAYGKSKLQAEQYLLSKQLPKGKSLFILRPCMIHGPGNKGNLNLLFKVVQKGIPWPLGSFNNKRSFLSIDNFCYVIEKILNNKVSQGVYNLADDEALSTNQIVEMISNQLGRKAKILRIPKPVIQFGAKLGNTLPLPLNEERLQKLTENYLVSNKKIVSELGEPLPVSAREGMRQTIQSLIKENG